MAQLRDPVEQASPTELVEEGEPVQQRSLPARRGSASASRSAPTWSWPFSGRKSTPAPMPPQPWLPVPDDEDAYEAACDILDELNRLRQT